MTTRLGTAATQLMVPRIPFEPPADIEELRRVIVAAVVSAAAMRGHEAFAQYVGSLGAEKWTDAFWGFGDEIDKITYQDGCCPAGWEP